jgi:hypothetical protein
MYFYIASIKPLIPFTLEIWKDGEKSLTKPPAFSSDNYGDKLIQVDNGGGKLKRCKLRRASIFCFTLRMFDNNAWDRIICNAREYLPESKKCRTSLASTSTLVADPEDFEDPDADS